MNPSAEQSTAYLRWLDERCAETSQFEPDADERGASDWCLVGLHTAYLNVRYMFRHHNHRSDSQGAA